MRPQFVVYLSNCFVFWGLESCRQGQRLLGLYRHNDDAYYIHPAHLALFPGLGSIRHLKYDECLPITAHCNIHTHFAPFIQFSAFFVCFFFRGGGHVFNVHARLRYCLIMPSYFTGEKEDRKDRGYFSLPCGGPAREPGRVSLHSPQSSSIVLSAAQHDTPGVECGDYGTHTWHKTQSGWRETQESRLLYTTLVQFLYTIPIVLFTVALIRDDRFV